VHAQRKFYELWEPYESRVGGQALKYSASRFAVEREARSLALDDRLQLRTLESAHALFEAVPPRFGAI
jgi:hypothetical protein